MDAKICYFDSTGKKNTERTLDLAVRRARERKISTIVVASTTGRTGVSLAEKATKKGIRTVVVTDAHGFEKKGEWCIEKRYGDKLAAMGIRIVSATHALSGVERSITQKFKGISRVELIAQALYSLFGQGMKVCVEISIMAADAGAIGCGNGEEIIAVAGTGEGADTAVVILPSHANSFFDLQVKEIIAMPRER